jgi:hypothetical protein
MRPRTPTFIWIPFVFSIGTISWAFLLIGAGLLAAVILTPAIQDVKTAEATRNDYQATLDLLNQKIAMQKEFVSAATHDPVLMERLAARQLNVNRPDQKLLILDPAVQYKDRSIETLLAESLTEVHPKPVTPIPPLLAIAAHPTGRPFLVLIACGALTLSFFLGVKYQRA